MFNLTLEHFIYLKNVQMKIKTHIYEYKSSSRAELYTPEKHQHASPKRKFEGTVN